MSLHFRQKKMERSPSILTLALTIYFWLKFEAARGCFSFINFRHAFHEDENFQYEFWQPPPEALGEAEDEAVMLIGGETMCDLVRSIIFG